MKIKLLMLVVVFIVMTGCQQAAWTETRAKTDVTQPGDDGKPTPPLQPPNGAQDFNACASQTLSVEVQASPASMHDFKVTTQRYPRIKVTKAKALETVVTYFLHATDGKRACKDQTCAEKAGWFEVQNDLLALNEIELSCLGAP